MASPPVPHKSRAATVPMPPITAKISLPIKMKNSMEVNMKIATNSGLMAVTLFQGSAGRPGWRAEHPA